ncbi:FAD linked oxidase N-terminal [Arabidopsis thaliana x Arabidopsis arenosa]|uniref:FAD linked oxidase N-terminal n=1 Tax=Arabidopsis thaliana x Arabidopsis arenosa TaxID=1240361 RepID=A0A8T1Y600_9BRAS|nr:FAD linked oxidase N-terminal [Arabidopsis thaliana x Arabidopsis arenosa]
MKLQSLFSYVLIFFTTITLLLSSSHPVSANQTNQAGFLQCLSLRFNDSNIVSRVIHTPNDTYFSSVLASSIQNPRFSAPDTPKPVLIITPVQPSDVQSAVKCARRFDIHIRTRSGGHDYEGLSYVTHKPFVILDLSNLRSITIDVDNRSVWVQTGATIGELYYEIGKKNRTLAFPAGVCPTVGVGGHFSGGGYGTLLRKHGLAADHVIDARVVDARGRILERREMGEDFFWAIRGGGGSSFCVVLSWKIGLINVPSTVTVFNVTKFSEQSSLKIIHRWQFVADRVSDDLFIRVMLQRYKNMVRASFPGLYLGSVNNLLGMVNREFPELGLVKDDCQEMSWIESVVWFAELGEEPIDVLSKRTRALLAFKAKSDFVQEPMPETAISKLWRRLQEPEAEHAQLIFTPFGGKMSEIADYETPFPHRKGNMYEIQYLNYWRGDVKEKYMRWVERVYEDMSEFVAKSPRGAYLNLRDLDLGMYVGGKGSKYEEGKSWGVKYFKNNFERLVRVKTSVDPFDFFCDEQSIPPFKSVEVI